MEKYKREWMIKLDNGEYLREWRGFTPFYAGCMYGDSTSLGGEEEFSHCYDFFSGIGDVMWWIKEELEKLDEVQLERLYELLKRNKEVDNFISESYQVIHNIVAELGLTETSYVYRLGNKLINEILNSESPTNEYKLLLLNEELVHRISFTDEDLLILRKNGISVNSPNKIKPPTPTIDDYWYINSVGLPKFITLDENQLSILADNGYDDNNVPNEEIIENLLNIKL